MQFDEMFPTRYLKGEDFLPNGTLVTITAMSMEAMQATSFAPSATKPVLYIEEFSKGIVLSRHLAAKISQILVSDNTDKWIGSQVFLYPVMVDSGDHPHLVIRAAAPMTQRNSSNQAEASNNNNLPRFKADDGIKPVSSFV